MPDEMEEEDDSSMFDFLRARNVQEDIIAKMKDDKVCIRNLWTFKRWLSDFMKNLHIVNFDGISM